jgi:hypothetical protein
MPRKKQRIFELEQDLNNEVIDSAQQSLLASKLDETLFVIDTTGSKKRKGEIEKLKSLNSQLSIAEKKKLVKISAIKSKVSIKSSKNEVVYDLWNDTESAKNTENSSSLHEEKNDKKKKKKKIPLTSIHPGFSYNPSKTDHAIVITEAVALEESKLKKEEKEKKTLASILKPTPVNYTFEDDIDSDYNDDSDIDDNSESEINNKKVKIKSKLTRSERNKKKEKKERKFLEEQNKKSLNIIKSINSLPLILKTIEAKEKSLKLSKSTSPHQPETDLPILTYEEAGHIPLSDELAGSLRKLVPKGNSVKDQVLRKVREGDMNSKYQRRKKMFEKPHGRRNLKWIPNIK